MAFYKGIAEPPQDFYETVRADMDQIKRDGVNVIAVFINLRWENGVLSWSPRNKKAVEDVIERAYASGVHVYLRVENPVFRTPEEWPKVEAQFSPFVLEAAELAEKYHVALFAPLTESNYWIGLDRANRWMQDILPAVRARYKGKLVYQVAVSKDWDMDYKGYDYLAIDFYAPRGPPLDVAAYRVTVRGHVDKALSYVSRDGLAGVLMGETAVMTKQPDRTLGQWEPFPFVTESEQADYIRAIAQEAKRGTKGLFYFGWNHPLTGVKGTLGEQALREEYTR